MKKIFTATLVLGTLFFAVSNAHAEEPTLSVSYPDGPILDSDLDGLTDVGETTIFKTDPKNPDSDSDGWYDGTEVLAKTDPLDSTSPSATTIVTHNPSSIEVPWVWYVTRASGIIAFAFAWLAIFLGIAVQTLFFALLHGISFLFDPFMAPSLADAFIPFHISPSKLDPLSLALGIMAFYGFIVLVITSWIKPMIPQRLWRITHFLNIFVYVAVIAHALLLGTDMKVPLYRNIFIGANVFLMSLLLINFALKLANAIRHMVIRQQPVEETAQTAAHQE